jgi:hypothetical protein
MPYSYELNECWIAKDKIMPTNEQTIRYLLDPVEIQDKIALYGLRQDLHRPDAYSKNILEHRLSRGINRGYFKTRKL